MLNTIPDNEELLRRITEYCAAENITRTDFSKLCGSVAIVTRLKSGKSVSIKTYNRIASIINKGATNGED